MHKLTLSIIFIIFSFTCNSQETEIIVKNIKGEPIPFASIYNNCGFGTITNEIGVFTVNKKLIRNDCPKLYISHLGFKQDSIELKSVKKGMDIYLKNNEIVLDEIIIGRFDVKKYINSVYKNLQANQSRSFEKSVGYYKQITKNNNKITELLEMINNFEYTNKGIEKWQIKNGRYAADTTGFLSFKNYSVYTREVYKTYGESNIMVSPISENSKNYDFFNIELYENGYRKINFKLRKSIRKKILPLSGSILINEKDSSIVKITGNIKSIVGIKKSHFPYKIRHYLTTYEIVYLENKFYYSQINTSFDVYKFFKKKHSINVKSFFVNLKENKTLNTNNETFFTSNSSDIEIIKQIKYNPKLWDNPKIKRIKEEESIIKKFEEKVLFNHK